MVACSSLGLSPEDRQSGPQAFVPHHPLARAQGALQGSRGQAPAPSPALPASPLHLHTGPGDLSPGDVSSSRGTRSHEGPSQDSVPGPDCESSALPTDPPVQVARGQMGEACRGPGDACRPLGRGVCGPRENPGLQSVLS